MRTGGCAPGAYSVSCSSFCEVLAEAAREHRASPSLSGRRCRSAAHLDAQLPAVEQHAPRAAGPPAAGDHVRDGGAAGAGAGGQRLPHPALEDPRADAGPGGRRIVSSSVYHETFVRLGNARRLRSPGRRRRGRAPASSGSEATGSRTGGCRSGRAGSARSRPPDGRPRRARRGRRAGKSAELRRALPNVDGARVRSGDPRADLPGGCADREGLLACPAAPAQVEDRLAGPVAGQLGLRAVGVEDAQRRPRAALGSAGESSSTPSANTPKCASQSRRTRAGVSSNGSSARSRIR